MPWVIIYVPPFEKTLNTKITMKRPRFLVSCAKLSRFGISPFQGYCNKQ
jgi:hypothetical protein